MSPINRILSNVVISENNFVVELKIINALEDSLDLYRNGLPIFSNVVHFFTATDSMNSVGVTPVNSRKDFEK